MKKLISEKTIISTCSLVSSLLTYYYSKLAQKDAVAYVMVGSYFGSWVGEMIVKIRKREN